MKASLVSLFKIRHAKRAVGADKQHLPAVSYRLNNEGVLNDSFHSPEYNMKLNDCKGVPHA